MDCDDAALTHVANLIAEVQPGSMVQRFVLLAEVIDEDGGRWFSSFTAPDQKRWDSMGLLDYGLTFERNFTSSEDDD